MSTLTLLLTLSAPPALAEALPDPATCTEPVDDYVEAVATGGKKEAYFCLAALDDAKAVLVANLETRTEGQHTRVSRALAVHLLQRLDQPLQADDVRPLEAVDKRLLRDGIYSHRGRETPAEEHAKVFEQFDWYKPAARFNNGKLTELDRQNIDLLDNIPAVVVEEPPEEKTAAEAIAETQAGPQEPGQVQTWCGCTATNPAAAAPAALGWLLGLGLLVGRRRREA